MSSQDPQDEKKSSKPTAEYDDVVIETEQLGVYRLLVSSSKGGFNLQRRLTDFQVAVPLLSRLFRDIYSVSPSLFICFIISRLWSALEDALFMYLSSSMLRTIEVGLLEGKAFVNEILWSLAARMLCTAIMAYFSWWSQELLLRLRNRIVTHFELYLMKVNLKLDIPTSLEATSTVTVTADDAWTAFDDILEYLTGVVTAASQLVVISNAARATNSPFFILICLARPLFSNFFTRSLWDKACYAYVTNVDHVRVKALEALASGGYRADVISGGLGSWIIEEYKKSRESLGDVSDDHPFYQYAKRQSPIYEVICNLLDDLPMVYCGMNAILYPSRFSIASISILQSSSSTLRYSIGTIFRGTEQFRRNVTSVKNLYQTSEIQNKLADGQISYPPSEKGSPNGMGFELRNLSFAYPGSTKSTNALTDITLSIPAGHLVVIVGGNGSGKSTILRMFARLFDPSSGQLLIDGHPAETYRMSDLRQATTLLSQDNLMYPLSFAENIGLGCIDSMSDMALIKEAAEKGGAAEFISKLESGYDTVLDPLVYSISNNLYGNTEHPLHEEMTKLEKKTNISGGEQQRIVAARSFMRLQSGKIKFIAVDEPSSALDAEGELQLFKQLLNVREGKTMIFVTHRFGHLTKHADMIICMKDGNVAETGRHEELMKEDGEYAKLYNIQAGAFSENAASTDEKTSES